MKVSLIAALSLNRVIGFENKLPWHLPEDLKYFRSTTEGHPVLMGRKTYESIGRLLPKRLNVILSRDPSYCVEGARTFTNIKTAIETLGQEFPNEELFVIGGAQIYKEALPFADCLYLTWVQREVVGDAFFPEYDLALFKETLIAETAETEPLKFVKVERFKSFSIKLS